MKFQSHEMCPVTEVAIELIPELTVLSVPHKVAVT